MTTTVLIIYIILVFASDLILIDRNLRPWKRFALALVWPAFCAFCAFCLLAAWLLTLPEKLG